MPKVLKLSSEVSECKPLPSAPPAAQAAGPCRAPAAAAARSTTPPSWHGRGEQDRAVGVPEGVGAHGVCVLFCFSAARAVLCEMLLRSGSKQEEVRVPVCCRRDTRQGAACARVVGML